MMNREEYIALFKRYLDGDASEEELRRLEVAVLHNSDVQQLLEEEMESALPVMDEEVKRRLYSRISAGVKPEKRLISLSPAWRRAMQWTAILLLPLLSAIATYFITQPSDLQDAPVTVSTGYGEKAEVTLPDGSRVWINAGSRLTYDNRYNRRQREVLLSGEAYFEVAQEKRKPFIVRTTDMVVEALGTSFNVMAYDDEPFASSVLLEGSLRVTAASQERLLSGNHRATLYKASSTLASDAVLASDYVVWKEGYIYFENSSFEDIAKRLSRMFNVQISFTSDELKKMRFTGTLGNSSIRNVLDILSLTSPMRYEMDGTTVSLYHKK